MVTDGFPARRPTCPNWGKFICCLWLTCPGWFGMKGLLKLAPLPPPGPNFSWGICLYKLCGCACLSWLNCCKHRKNRQIYIFLQNSIISMAIKVKVAFFQKLTFVFQISQNYSRKLSWPWNLSKLFTDMGGNFHFQAQNSFLDYFFWEIWKTTLSEKKAPLVQPGCPS